MVSLEQAQERFTLAIAGLERALGAVQKRQDQQQETARELAALKARHVALESEHAHLRKSYDALRKQQLAATKRLDGTIASLHEVLGV